MLLFFLDIFLLLFYKQQYDYLVIFSNKMRLGLIQFRNDHAEFMVPITPMKKFISERKVKDIEILNWCTKCFITYMLRYISSEGCCSWYISV